MTDWLTLLGNAGLSFDASFEREKELFFGTSGEASARTAPEIWNRGDCLQKMAVVYREKKIDEIN